MDIEYRSRRSLEWDRLVAYLAEEARSDFGKERCLSLVLEQDRHEVERLIDETDEALSLLTNRSALLVDVVPDLREILPAVSAQSKLMPEDLLAIGTVLKLAKSVKSSLSLLQSDSFPRLCTYNFKIHAVDDLRREIDRCIDEQGAFKDEASSELRNLRQSLRKLHNEIRNELNRLIHSSNVSKALQEPIYTQRSGRYVLPVDVTKRGTVDGIVHDSSASGLTVYVEPMSVVEPTNKIRIKEGEIEREIERLLLELSSMAHENVAAIDESFETLTTVDVIMARARLALRYKGIRPELSKGDTLHVIGASHPLLVLQKDKPVVSNDIKLGDDERTLVITGPNTGGKTVLLKQIGLMALMVRGGLLIPCEAGAKMPVFNAVWADIGDEQSLAQSLSTFSSHMKNIVEIVSNASNGKLILLDEIGVGTDPKEGAALAHAVLEHLNKSGAITVTTTHYGELKMLAYSEPGFVNGSLEFDETNLNPTYKLRIGMAGSSKGTTIALRLGLDRDVVDRAQQLLQGREEEISHVMAELERRTALVNKKEEQLSEQEKELISKRSELESESEKHMAEVDRKRKEYALQLDENYNAAMDLIKTLTRELQATPNLRGAQQAREKLEEIRKDLGWLEPEPKVEKPHEPIKEGQEVKILSLNQVGVVESLLPDGGEVIATVRLGNMRVKVKADDLRVFTRTAQPKSRSPKKHRADTVQSRGRGRTSEATLDAFIRTSTNTLDLRGQRVDAALDQIDKFLDNCSIEGISPLMIIHGHGTGAVKSAVRDYLSTSRYVDSFRPGEIYEGGDGVTIVLIK